MLLRRLRGLIGSTLLASGAWASLGCIIGLVIRFAPIPGLVFVPGPSSPGGVVTTLTLVGAATGAINGLAFGLLVLAAERRRRVTEIGYLRFAT